MNTVLQGTGMGEISATLCTMIMWFLKMSVTVANTKSRDKSCIMYICIRNFQEEHLACERNTNWKQDYSGCYMTREG